MSLSDLSSVINSGKAYNAHTCSHVFLLRFQVWFGPVDDDHSEFEPQSWWLSDWAGNEMILYFDWETGLEIMGWKVGMILGAHNDCSRIHLM